MDTNPIKYSDLVRPDNSIEELIGQLDELIKKYDEAKGKIKGAADELAKSTQNLSGATEEQRKQIELVTKESDRLAQSYKKSNDLESETYRRRQQVVQAVKEQQRIDKLVVELNNSKAGSYNRLSAQYRLNKIRLNEMSAEERKATQSGRDLETETRKIYEEMSRLQKATGKYTLEVGHYENALRSLPGPLGVIVNGFGRMRNEIVTIGNSALPIGQKGLQIFGTAMLGTVGIIMSFVRYLTGAARAMREFEQANANLATILGTSVSEMSALTNSALALGRTTEYTARQVTELQTELAKLGFNKGEIVNMEEAVLRFATAVGANLADAASVAGSTLRAFGLSSRDADEVLGTLAVATNNSALSFHRIEESIGTVFPVANAFGISVKDITALLGGLANAGFDASSAATATRNILLNLADSNGKLARSMGGPVRTFDEMIDGMIRLRDSGVDVATALELTDKRSVAAFTAFLSGAESVRELRESLEDVGGELERIQKERLDTVEGSTKLLKSAWEGLTLAFRESNGAIKNTIDWLTRLITKTNELLFPTQALTARSSEDYTKRFQTLYEEQGEKAVGAIKNMVDSLDKEAQYFEKKGGFWNILFKDARAGFDAKRMKGVAEGAKQAADIVLAQIEADAKGITNVVTDAGADATKKVTDDTKKAAKKAEDEAKEQRIANLRAKVEQAKNERDVAIKGTEEELAARAKVIKAQRDLELEQNKQKTETARKDEALINAKYDKMLIADRQKFYDEVNKVRIASLQREEQSMQLDLQITPEGTEEMLQRRLALIDKQREIAIAKNNALTVEMREDEVKIDAKYDAMILKTTADFYTKREQVAFNAMQEATANEFSMLNANERQKTLFRLDQERERLAKVLELNALATEQMTAEEVAAIKTRMAAITKEMQTAGFSNLYEVFGLNVTGEQQSALNTAFSSIKDSLGSLADSWEAAADAAVESANKQVESAQRALDAEIEAREQGYANSVEMAQKELSLAQQQQTKALAEQKKAQKAQAAVDSLTQASSLITASANIWKSLSGIPIVGYALAIAAIASMWGSFASAKIKASQVSKETYGEGTVELLEGGSHASGHDIDLGTKADGTKRRAEGGEYFAVINKRSSRRYRRQIPDIINALNDGTFAEKYVRAGEKISTFAVQGGTDISGLSKDVHAIREQGNTERYLDGNGAVVIRYKNLTRKIKS